MHPPSSSTFSLIRSASAAPRKLPFSKSIKALSTVSSRSHAASSPALRFQSRPTPSSSRAFATTSTRCSVATQKLKTQHAEVVSYPSRSDLKQEEEDEEELDVEYVSPDDVAVQLTDRAAEQLRSIVQREGNPGAALRIAVESGGCHGYQYKLELSRERQPDDYHLSHPTIKPSNVYIDAMSMSLVKGSTIDFATELIGSSFRVVDNPQAKGNGCGCGVSWELNL